MNPFLLVIFNIAVVFNLPAKYNYQNQDRKTLEITVTGIANQDGLILLSLFDSEDGFPGEREKAITSLEKKITNDKVSFVIKDLPAGNYAVSLIHDENNNKKLDTNFVGIPKEGYGASNNLKKMFRAPRFEEASFVLDEDPKKIEIEINYL